MNTTTDNNADALAEAGAPVEVSAPNAAPATPDQVPAPSRKKRAKAPSNNADAAAPKPAREKKSESKAEAVLKRLRSAKGASLQQLVGATGWQAHSVRGFLSGTVRKKLGLTLVSEKGKDGLRRYRIDGNGGGDAGADEAAA